jgi:hypothetical protein
VPVPRDAAGPDGTIGDPAIRAALAASLTELVTHVRTEREHVSDDS